MSPLLLAVGYAVALVKMPDWMQAKDDKTQRWGPLKDPKDRHNARLIVVSAGGAIVVAVSLLYTRRSYRLSHRGQVIDRYTKALERLSSSDIDARLGGIYGLAHVANDSRPHHDDVIEVLEAFIRRQAPKARRDDDPGGSPPAAYDRELPRSPCRRRPSRAHHAWNTTAQARTSPSGPQGPPLGRRPTK